MSELCLYIAGKDAPSQMEDRHWQSVARSFSLNSRESGYAFAARNERRKAKVKGNKLEAVESPQEIVGGLFMLAVKRAVLFSTYNTIQFGPDLIIDCSFHQLMNSIATKSLMTQLTQSIGHAKYQRFPMHLHLTGVEPYNQQAQLLASPHITNVPFLSTTRQGFEELYDLDKLVYLTPDAPEAMAEYSQSNTYIIGGLVDVQGSPRTTYSKAKQLGIRMASLPLERCFTVIETVLCHDTVF